MKSLETVTVETGPNPTFSIIWMHGLGADGHDFEPLVPELLDDGMPALRFMFPHAPVRPVTINNGYQMRAWYDIIGIDRRSTEDFAGIKASADAIGDLIKAENERGVATERIAIAGFSQGGAMALHIATRYPEKLRRRHRPVLLSTAGARARDGARTRPTRRTPIFMAHGTQDPVVPYPLGDESRQLLAGCGLSGGMACLSDAAFAVRARGRRHPGVAQTGLRRLTRRHRDDRRRLSRPVSVSENSSIRKLNAALDSWSRSSM